MILDPRAPPVNRIPEQGGRAWRVATSHIRLFACPRRSQQRNRKNMRGHRQH